VDDVLEYRMNRVTVVEGAGRKNYDLEVEHDAFWKKNAPMPFPQAIGDNEVELRRIKELEKEIKNKTTSGEGAAAAASAPNAAGASEGGTSELLATVDSLPKLLERKKKLESHTNILSATMKVIAARDLPVFFEAETSGRSDKDNLLALLSSSSKGSLADKLRLLAVLTLRAADPAAAAMLAELEAAVSAGYADAPAAVQAELAAGLAGIKHMKQMQSFQQKSPTVKVSLSFTWFERFPRGAYVRHRFSCVRRKWKPRLRQVAASGAGCKAKRQAFLDKYSHFWRGKTKTT